jgi:hypothetical protein
VAAPPLPPALLAALLGLRPRGAAAPPRGTLALLTARLRLPAPGAAGALPGVPARRGARASSREVAGSSVAVGARQGAGDDECDGGPAEPDAERDAAEGGRASAQGTALAVVSMILDAADLGGGGGDGGGGAEAGSAYAGTPGFSADLPLQASGCAAHIEQGGRRHPNSPHSLPFPLPLFAAAYRASSAAASRASRAVC